MSELTRNHSGRWLILGTIFATIVALAIFSTARNASGGEPILIEEDAGVILVSTGPGGNTWIRYFADPTGPNLDINDYDAAQAISVNRCKVSTNGSLLELSRTGGNKGIGLVNNGIGVRTKNNCSTAQGRIGSGQSLTFTLGGFFSPDIYIDSVEADVEGKHGADLGYSLNNSAGSGTINLSNSSDNGPDSGTGDNEIAEISGAGGVNFTEITFTAVGSGAEVSIEGGGDGAVAGGVERTALGVSQTLFKLVTSQTFEGELDCEESVSETATGAAATSATVTRQDHKDTCTNGTDLIAYNLVIDGNGVLFDPNIGDRTDTNFLVQVDWAPYADPFNPPHREISFDGLNYELVTACESQLDEGANDEPLFPDPDDVFIHPADTPWCLAGEIQVLLGDGTWQQIHWYDGGTDPFFR